MSTHAPHGNIIYAPKALYSVVYSYAYYSSRALLLHSSSACSR